MPLGSTSATNAHCPSVQRALVADGSWGAQPRPLPSVIGGVAPARGFTHTVPLNARRFPTANARPKQMQMSLAAGDEALAPSVSRFQVFDKANSLTELNLLADGDFQFAAVGQSANFVERCGILLAQHELSSPSFCVSFDSHVLTFRRILFCVRTPARLYISSLLSFVK